MILVQLTLINGGNIQVNPQQVAYMIKRPQDVVTIGFAGGKEFDVAGTVYDVFKQLKGDS